MNFSGFPSFYMCFMLCSWLLMLMLMLIQSSLSSRRQSHYDAGTFLALQHLTELVKSGESSIDILSTVRTQNCKKYW